ncbi:hypothetical protein QYE76_051263 [Lolium multiflorum]|uniref:Uncharacterized protein n=1 Tax=Lolium multiflorum TaxID=4521 RepID=A0AAD8SSS2_LOLMU|nr:hypothetical protein QYE76_051263 [Lolium multiflorum]
MTVRISSAYTRVHAYAHSPEESTILTKLGLIPSPPSPFLEKSRGRENLTVVRPQPPSTPIISSKHRSGHGQELGSGCWAEREWLRLLVRWQTAEQERLVLLWAAALVRWRLLPVLVRWLKYNTDDEVDEDNFESYVQRQLKRFESRKLKTLHRGRHVCPFCPCKVKDGLLASLEMHAMGTRHSVREWQGKADHKALPRFVLGPRLPRSGRIFKRCRDM